MPASLTILIAMIVAVASVALYRKMVIRDVYDTLHIADPSGQSTQRELARTLKQIDRLGIGLTVATVLYAVLLLAVFLYKGLMNGTLG
jgi:hypothetical protein